MSSSDAFFLSRVFDLRLVSCLMALACNIAQAQTTAFTYQGVLRDNGTLINGVVDLQVLAFDALSGGVQVGATQQINDVAVVNGVFSSTLDFGAIYAGNARFLEIRVANSVGPGPASSYTTLTPRQPVASVPIASTVPDGAITSS